MWQLANCHASEASFQAAEIEGELCEQGVCYSQRLARHVLVIASIPLVVLQMFKKLLSKTVQLGASCMQRADAGRDAWAQSDGWGDSWGR